MDRFVECWEGLEDPRTGNAGLHEFHELLTIALCTTLCGGQSAVDMALFAKAKEPFLRGFLKLENGLPSHDTFSRLFRQLDPTQFGAAFRRFMAMFSETIQGVVAIDGKVLRRVEIPFSQRVQCDATVGEWHPPVPYDNRPTETPSDIAVLRLATEQPISVVARMASGHAPWGLEFRTLGFPVEYGQPADGETMSEDTGGWIHLRATKDYGHIIKPGFSGKPAFAVNDGAVLGMIVAVARSGDTRLAYGEPLRHLQIAWPRMARPYKGLARFEPADMDLFFGRESIVQELLGRVESQPLTLIVGPSGGGKSSLVFGGLVPKLEVGWRSATFRPGREPINNLAWALAELVVARGDPKELMHHVAKLRRGLREGADTLFDAAHALRHMSPDTRILLIVDQFEELFTLCRDEAERTAFIRIVSRVASQTDTMITLVCTLRADFMGDVLRSTLSQSVEGQYLMLRAMNGHELGQAIRQPAAHFGVRFADGVDDDILAVVAEDADALPLMEFALDCLWNEQEDRTLTRAAYERMGGLEGALAQHANEVIDGMGRAAQASAPGFSAAWSMSHAPAKARTLSARKRARSSARSFGLSPRRSRGIPTANSAKDQLGLSSFIGMSRGVRSRTSSMKP